MNDFKRNDRFGGKRTGSRPPFGGKPSFQRPGGGFGRPQMQMFPATCAQCGKATEVPFRPDGQRPIYCRDCLGGNKTSMPASGQGREFPKRDFQKPSFAKTSEGRPAFRAPVAAQSQAPDSRISDIQQSIAKMQLKLDKILLEIAVAKAQAGAEVSTVKKAKPTKKK